MARPAHRLTLPPAAAGSMGRRRLAWLGRARHAEALLPLRGGGPAPAENPRGAAGAEPRRAGRGVPPGDLR